MSTEKKYLFDSIDLLKNHLKELSQDVESINKANPQAFSFSLFNTLNQKLKD